MISTTATTQLDADNPWPGLEAFEENARAFFHGRDREAESLLKHVLDAPVTVLYGRSGLGKTSLLRAGLFPMLRERNFLPIYVRFDVKPGAPPLTRQLHQIIQNSIRAEFPDAVLPSDGESLWEYLHRTDFELWSAQNYPLMPVIVLDQFEELFTLGERVRDLVLEFRDDLGDLAENRIPADLAARIDADEAVASRFHVRSRNYKLVISLREDFLPELEGWRRLIPALGRKRMRLLRLRGREAFEAVREPAADLMTDALARRVVGIIAGEDLGRDRDTDLPDGARPGAELDAAEVEPALLSLFCRELNEERKRRGQPSFDEQLVEDAKRDILSNYYLSCVSDLPPRVARFIETELITEKGYRNSYAREDAVPAHLTDDELTRLIRMRLLRLEERYGAQRIELTHDVLTGVVREHRDQRRAAEEKKALAAHAERQQAELQASRLRAAALRKRSRVLMVALAVTTISTVVAVVLGVVAVTRGTQARNSFRDATGEKLENDAQGILQGTQTGGDIRAFQELLAAQSLKKAPRAAPLYAAAVKRASTSKVIKIPGISRRIYPTLSADGSRMAAIGSGRREVDIWDTQDAAATGKPLTGAENDLYAVAISSDGKRIVAGGADGEILLWDARTGRVISHSKPNNSPTVTAVQFSPDGRRLASGSPDGTVRIWDPVTGQPTGVSLTIDPLPDRSGRPEVDEVAFSNNGRRLAVGVDDNSVRLWNADTRQPIGAPLTIKAPTGHEPEVTSLAFSPDGHRLVSAHGGGQLGLWDADAGRPIGEPVDADKITVDSLAFSRDGHHVISGGEDGTLRLWKVDPIQSVGEPLRGHTAPVKGVAFSADGGRIYSASVDETIRWWDWSRVRPLIEYRDLVGTSFSGDGTRIALSGVGGTVQVYDAKTGATIGPPLAGNDEPGGALSHDGRRMVTADEKGTLRLWNVDTGEQILTVPGEHGTANGIAFSPDDQRVAASYSDGTIQVWDAGTGHSVMSVEQQAHEVYTIRYSPDGERIFAAVGSEVMQFNARTGDQIGTPLRDHNSISYDIEFSHDGRRVATIGQDGTAMLWDAKDGTPMRQPTTSHQQQVTSEAFSPDDHFLVTGDASGTFRLWNAENGEPVGEGVGAHEDIITGLAFSPDGRHIVSSSHDGTVRVWPAPVIPPDLCSKVAVNMSHQLYWNRVSPNMDYRKTCLPLQDQLCSKLTQNISHKQWQDWVSPKIDYIKTCPDLPVAPD